MRPQAPIRDNQVSNSGENCSGKFYMHLALPAHCSGKFTYTLLRVNVTRALKIGIRKQNKRHGLTATNFSDFSPQSIASEQVKIAFQKPAKVQDNKPNENKPKEGKRQKTLVENANIHQPMLPKKSYESYFVTQIHTCLRKCQYLRQKKSVTTILICDKTQAIWNSETFFSNK